MVFTKFSALRAQNLLRKTIGYLKNFPRCARQKQIGFFRPTQGFSAAGKIKIGFFSPIFQKFRDSDRISKNPKNPI